MMMTPDELRALADAIVYRDSLAIARAADYLRAQADAQPVAVPAGWRLVPVDPTPEMLASTSWPGCAGTDYAHMLAAAPAAPQAEPETFESELRSFAQTPEQAEFVEKVLAAEPKREASCLWSRADDDTDVWETRCGHAFTIIDGTPGDNHMEFCCYCGRPLEQEIGGSDE